MRNWKTSASGAISAAAAFVMFSPETFSCWPAVILFAKFVTVGGLVSMGLACKDSTNHSTAAEVQASTIEKGKI